MAPVASAITRVLVTGFGPFSGIENNPSWGIASRLPATLPNNIELIVHPQYVPVAYHPVIDLVPKLVKQHNPDIVLSMGVDAGRNYFAVEQNAWRDGYHWSPDVDGKIFTEEENRRVWGDQPTKLSTDLDLNAVVAEWRNRTASFKWPPGLGKLKAREGEVVALQGSVDVEFKEDVVGPLLHNEVGTEDVRWSDAVGTYLCGFIYFTDLVEMGKNGKNKKRDVSFMHVPYLRSEEELKVGVDVAKELVQSLVKTWRAQRGA